jgi:hypothetical protein
MPSSASLRQHPACEISGGTPARLRASARSGIERVDDDEPRADVHYAEMTFFTHQVSGQTYGGWYRQLAPHEIEIMGAGFLCKTSYAGSDELSVARSVLEEFVRMQMRTGGRLQPLDPPDHRDSTSR